MIEAAAFARPLSFLPWSNTMTCEWITREERALMLVHGARSAAGEAIDPRPVVKLFTPDGAATWLLTELDPEDPDIAFGLCDLGLGCPELGWVSLGEVQTVRGHLGLPVEVDRYFNA